MKVSNFYVKNQFIVTDNGSTYFQSYDTIIVKKTKNRTILDKKALDYSRTTSKYLYRFLDEYTTLPTERNALRKYMREHKDDVMDLN